MWSEKGQEFSDDLFILKKYTNNFKIPTDGLNNIMKSSKLSDYLHLTEKLGFEYFTNGPCLLLKEDKIDWIKDELNFN